MERIGRFEIQAELGRGGFGRVYKAYDPTVGRIVAIKVLLPEATDAEFLSRFQMEASTAGNLHHPNLVTIHEFGKENDSHYLVMEYLEGRDLQRLITERAQLTILEKVEIMQQVASGLHCAHENGVIHRDVKPSNIMVMRENMVKVMDFGIARLTRNDTTRMTRAGFLVGTLAYMSPEQFRDHEVDALCDIWAFGVIYYEFLVGKSPFEGATMPAVLYAITSVEPPPPASLVPDCPEALSQVIMRALSKDRDLRYHSLQEFQLDVNPILLDLRRTRAEELLPEARTLFEQEKAEDAQRVVRRILDLDPMNTEARQLRERIQRMVQQQAILPRIGILKQTGSEQLSQGRYAEAIQTFENALRLDSQNTEIKKLLEQARNSVTVFKRAQDFADAAAALADAGDFDNAHNLVQQALRIDMTNKRAREVMSRVQHHFDTQERRKEVQEIAAKARDLMARQAFDDALAMLTEARNRLRDPAELVAASEEAQTAKKAQAEKERIARALDQVRSMLQQERVAEAESLLAKLQKEIPDNPSIAQAVAEAKEVRKVLDRRAAVARVVERTRQFHQDGELERGSALVRRALEEFPGEPELVKLEQETESLIRKRDERRQVEDALRQARDLRAGGDAAAALKLLQEAQRRLGNIPALASLAAEIERDLKAQQSRQVASQISEEVRGMIAHSDWATAAARLRAALQQFPGEPELTALSASVERGLQEEQTRKEREAAIAKAREARGGNDLKSAAAQVAQIRAKYGDWPALLDLEREIAEEQAVREKRQAITAAGNAAREKIGKAQWKEAREVLQQALAKWPSEPELSALLTSVERGIAEQQSRIERDEVLQKCRVLENEGKDAEALGCLDEALKKYPSDPELYSARTALAMRSSERQRAGDISARTQRIQRALDTNQFDTARKELEEARSQLGDQAALKRLADELEVRRRAAELDAVARNIEQLLERGAIPEAQKQLQAALAANHRDPKLLRLQQALESETLFLEAIQKVEQNLNARRFDLAEAALRGASGMKPDNDRIKKLTQRLTKERDKAASERVQALKKARELTANGAFDEAGALLRSLLEQNPGDADAVRAQDEWNAAKAAQFKRLTYANRIKDLEAKRKSDQPHLVKEGAAILLAEFPGDSNALALMEWADRRLEEIGVSSIMPVQEAAPSFPLWKIGIAAAIGVLLATGLYLMLRPKGQAASWAVSPEKITFQWRIGETLPDAKQIGLSSARGIVELKAKASEPWLTIEPAEAKTGEFFGVAIAPQGMNAGDYKAFVDVESAAAEPKSRRIEVAVKILPRQSNNASPGTTIVAEPDILTFNVQKGSAAPDPKPVRIRGTGVGNVNISARSSKGAWLRVNPGSSGLPASVSVQIAPEGLPAGLYQGSIVIAGDGATQQVPVSLRVSDPAHDTKPPVTPDPKPPVVTETKPVVPEPKPPKPEPCVLKSTANYGGLLRGSMTWVGELAPGQRVTINKSGQSSVPGRVNGRIFEGDIPVTIAVSTPGIKVESAPAAGDCYSRFILVNTSSAPITLISISWKVVE